MVHGGSLLPLLEAKDMFGLLASVANVGVDGAGGATVNNDVRALWHWFPLQEAIRNAKTFIANGVRTITTTSFARGHVSSHPIHNSATAATWLAYLTTNTSIMHFWHN